MLDWGPWGAALRARGYLLPAVQLAAWTVFAALWYLISKSDDANKKIKHKDLLNGAGFASVCYALMFLSTVLGRFGRLAIYYDWAFYRDLLSHVVVACAAALALWVARVWPAGDAKLFVLLSLIFPMMPTAPPFHAGWLSLYVLINIFIPACAAVFATSVGYIWRTRLIGYSGFLRTLAARGWRVLAGFLVQNVKEAAAATVRTAGEDLKWALTNPGGALLQFGKYGMSMLLMALVSVAIQGLFGSPTLRTLLCFGAMFLWMRIEDFFGKWFPWAVGALMIALAGSGLVAFHWHDLYRSFGFIMIFSFFLSLGARATMGALKGQYVMMVFPLVTVLAGALPLEALAHWSGTGAGLAWELAKAFAPLAFLGAFFGLSFVFVRVWDDEAHPNIPRDKVLSYMLPHHSMIALLQKDEEYFAEHFASLYADGLTIAQAEALRRWCRKNRVENVPITTTMPFAHWIFLGYLLTWLLSGHVLQPLLR